MLHAAARRRKPIAQAQGLGSPSSCTWHHARPAFVLMVAFLRPLQRRACKIFCSGRWWACFDAASYCPSCLSYKSTSWDACFALLSNARLFQNKAPFFPSPVGTRLAVDLHRRAADLDGVVVAALRLLVYAQPCNRLRQPHRRRAEQARAPPVLREMTYGRRRPSPSCPGRRFAAGTPPPPRRAGWPAARPGPSPPGRPFRGS